MMGIPEHSPSLEVYSIAAAVPGRILAVKRIGPHNMEVISLLTGCLIGDGWGTHIKGNALPSVRFGLEQAIKNSGYLLFVWKRFQELGYCTLTPFISTRASSVQFIRFYLNTFTSLYWVFSGFYTFDNGRWVKHLPEWVEIYLTPVAVAHWFQQDGSRQHGQGVFFATHNFTHADCLRLAEILTRKYGLKISVIKDGFNKAGVQRWRLNLWKRSMPAFVALVRPHMHSSMLYKLEGYV